MSSPLPFLFFLVLFFCTAFSLSLPSPCRYQRLFQFSIYTLSLIPYTAKKYSLVLVPRPTATTILQNFQTFCNLFFLHAVSIALCRQSFTEIVLEPSISKYFYKINSRHLFPLSALAFFFFLAVTVLVPYLILVITYLVLYVHFCTRFTKSEAQPASSPCHIFSHSLRLFSVTVKVTKRPMSTPITLSAYRQLPKHHKKFFSNLICRRSFRNCLIVPLFVCSYTILSLKSASHFAPSFFYGFFSVRFWTRQTWVTSQTFNCDTEAGSHCEAYLTKPSSFLCPSVLSLLT